MTVDSMLSSAQIEEFERNGYLVFKRMVSSTTCDQMLAITHQHLESLHPPIEYEAEVGYAGAPASLDAPGGCTVRRLRDAYHRHACFQQWAEDKDLLLKLRQLLNEKVCLTLAHHNCVMTKHPNFGTATGWHRDIRYWSFTKPELVSVWLALGKESDATGGLRVIPGSHRMQLQPGQLDELDFLKPEHPDNQALVRRGVTVELEKGDVLFFHSKLFHAAGRNAGANVKTSVVFAYHGADNIPLPGTRSAAAGSVLLSR